MVQHQPLETRMCYQRSALSRKTKISDSVFPPLSPSASRRSWKSSLCSTTCPYCLARSTPFFPFSVRSTVPSNSFHCCCLLSATITRRVKDPSGERESHPLSRARICSGAPRISASVSPPLYRELSSPLSGSSRFCVLWNALVLDITLPLRLLPRFLLLLDPPWFNSNSKWKPWWSKTLSNLETSEKRSHL